MMNDDSTRVMRRPRRAWPSAARTSAAIIAAAALVLLAACSGSPSSTASNGSSTAAGSADSHLVAFSRCVRSRGVPDFPDPLPGQVNAKFPGAQQLKVSSSQLQGAENACQHLLANTGSGPNQGGMQQELSGMRRFSECLRAHGMPNWPDPSAGSQGLVFDLLSYQGIDIDSPQGQAAQRECQHLLPPQLNGDVPLERP